MPFYSTGHQIAFNYSKFYNIKVILKILITYEKSTLSKVMSSLFSWILPETATVVLKPHQLLRASIGVFQTSDL